MVKLTDTQLQHLADDLAKRTHRASVELGALLVRLDQWSPAGTTSPGGDGVRGGGTSNPVESKALPRTPEGQRDQWREDEFIRARKRVIGMFTDMTKILNGYDRLVEAMSVMQQHQAQRLAEEEAAIGCECANLNCRAWITGLGDDRPRGGRCGACRKYTERNGTERPHQAVHPILVPECAHCARVHGKVSA